MPTYLVTGATGRIGHSLTRTLLSQNHQVHALVRDPLSPKSQALRALGATLFQGSYNDLLALESASKSCAGIFVLTNPNPNELSEARNILTSFLKSCADPSTSVGVLVTRAGVGEQDRFPNWPPTSLPFVVELEDRRAEVERLFKSAGLAHWTILQPGYFASNFIDPGLRDFIWAGLRTEKKLVAGVDPETLWEVVDPADIGVVAAKAFTINRKEEDGTKWERRTIKVAGELLTLEQQAEILSRVSGVQVEAVFLGEGERKEKAQTDFMGYMHLWQRTLSPQVDLGEMRELGVDMGGLEAYLVRHREELIQGLKGE